MNTLPGTSDITTPIAKSTPITHSSQMPALPNIPSSEKDILEPMSSEQARSTYLKKQIQGMSSEVTPEYTFIGGWIIYIHQFTK